MSQSLKGCRRVPAWVKPFLTAIGNGYNEVNAANMAGVSTSVIKQHVDKDDKFKKEYTERYENRRSRPALGAW